MGAGSTSSYLRPAIYVEEKFIDFSRVRAGRKDEGGPLGSRLKIFGGDSTGLSGWFIPGQENVVEIHARRAGDVELLDQLEAGDAEGPPWEVCLISNGQTDGEGYELGP